jgi:hypothetical protein
MSDDRDARPIVNRAAAVVGFVEMRADDDGFVRLSFFPDDDVGNFVFVVFFNRNFVVFRARLREKFLDRFEPFFGFARRELNAFGDGFFGRNQRVRLLLSESFI